MSAAFVHLGQVPSARETASRAMLAIGGIALLTAIGLAARVSPPAVAPPTEKPASVGALAAFRSDAENGSLAALMRTSLVPATIAPNPWGPGQTAAPVLCGLTGSDTAWSSLMRAEPTNLHKFNRLRAARRHGARRTRAAWGKGFGTLRFEAAMAARNDDPALDSADIAALTAPPTKTPSAAASLGNPSWDPVTRRTTQIGVGAEALQFDDRPGHLSLAARAGLWNDTPATAMGIGYTLPNSHIRVDAAALTNVNGWQTPVGKTFNVSTVASIPFD